MLNIQEYISCFENIEQANPHLRQKLSVIADKQQLISASDGTQWDSYYYRPGLHADETNPITKESNGLILDEDGDIIAKAFNMPLELDDIKGIPSEFDIEDCHLQEMTDGVRIIIYSWGGEWYVASENSVTGDELIHNTHKDVPALYNHIIQDHIAFRGDYIHWSKPFADIDPKLCFVFDYVDPRNCKIAPVYSNSLVLLTIVDKETGRELPQPRSDSFCNQWDLARPKGVKVEFSKGVQDFIDNMNTFSKGAMLVDSNGMRVKINNTLYYAIRNAIQAGDVITPTHVAKIVQACKDQIDLVQTAKEYPQFQHAISFMMQVRDALWEELTILWNAAKIYKDDPKVFADMVKDHPLNAVMFLKRDGQIDSIRDAVYNMDAHKLVANSRRKDEKEFELIKRNLKIGNVLGGLEHGGV